MNRPEEIVKCGVTITVKEVRGRSTKWIVECDDSCVKPTHLDGINPPTRERGHWLAVQHNNSVHNGTGSIRVMWAKGRTKGRRHG